MRSENGETKAIISLIICFFILNFSVFNINVFAQNLTPSQIHYEMQKIKNQLSNLNEQLYYQRDQVFELDYQIQMARDYGDYNKERELMMRRDFHLQQMAEIHAEMDYLNKNYYALERALEIQTSVQRSQPTTPHSTPPSEMTTPDSAPPTEPTTPYDHIDPRGRGFFEDWGK